MFPILLLSFSVHSLIPKFPCSISSSFSFIISIVLHPFALPPFHLLQFLSNFVQYSLSYLLSVYLYNFFTINLSSNSPLLNIPSSLSCLLMSSISLLYSFSNSFIISFTFPRFSFPFQVSNSAINPFYRTRYLSFSLIYHLFNILSTSYFSSPSIITGADCSFLCSSICSTYFCILLTLTTECILIVAGSFNSTAFVNIIFLIL